MFIDGTETDPANVRESDAAGEQPTGPVYNEHGFEVVEYGSTGARSLGTEIGVVELGLGDGIYRGRVKNVTGRHALYFVADLGLPKGTWPSSFFNGRVICELEEFVFLK